MYLKKHVWCNNFLKNYWPSLSRSDKRAYAFLISEERKGNRVQGLALAQEKSGVMTLTVSYEVVITLRLLRMLGQFGGQ